MFRRALTFFVTLAAASCFSPGASAADPASQRPEPEESDLSIGAGLAFGLNQDASVVLGNLDNWSLHGQTTGVYQASLPLHAAYSGLYSLGPAFDARETLSATLYLGYRLLPGTEIFFNPESFQGFGLETAALGLAGFPNGEASQVGFGYAYPYYNSARMFVRQTIGLGGETENIDDDANFFGGKVDVSRLTLTIGKLSIPDIFDRNAYAHDQHAQFMNYTLIDAGAFDFACDLKGYTWGGAGELNQKTWALRAGYFLETVHPESNDFDTAPRAGQSIAELEERYQAMGQAGKLRLDAWWDDAVAGSFNQALYNPAISVAHIDSTWRHRVEYGFIANVEQAITEDLGVFSRLSWRSGGTQITSWTDIDQSASAGAVLKGTSWGRPLDTIGLAGVVNGLHQSYINFLAAGGLGMEIGDGALDYRGEKIVETYYQIGLSKSVALTLDYQFIDDPAYNRARGPANVFAARFHAQF